MTERKNVLVCVLPGRGHVTPTAAVVEALVNDGARVRVVTGSKCADRFSRLGADVVLMSAGADFDDSDLDASFPGRSRLWGLALARHDLRESFVRPIPARWATVQEAITAEPVDAVLCGPLFMAGIPLLLNRVDRYPRVYVLGFLPLSLPSLASPEPDHGAREWAMEQLMGMMARPVQSEAEKITLALTGRSFGRPFLNWIDLSDGIFQMTCPGFEYPRPEASVPIRYIGAAPSPSGVDHALPDWWCDLDTELPIVHITQATVENGDLGDLILPAIEALADEDVLVVVATGGTSLEGKVPSNVRITDFVPYDNLLPRCSLMITNGGYGGVNLALRNGVLLLVVGSSEDKRLIAQRVTWSGAGVGIARRTISSRRLRRTARAILFDPRYRERARELSAEMACTGGVETIVEEVRRTT